MYNESMGKKAMFEEDDFEFLNKNGSIISPNIKEKNSLLAIFTKIFTFAIFALIVFIIYESIMLAKYYYDLYQNNELTEKVKTIYHSPLTQTSTNSTSNYDLTSDDMPQSNTSTPNINSDKLNKNKIIITELKNAFSNNDIFAYLKIDGSNIDFPVTHTVDNDFYIENDLYKNLNATGSIFMDYENSKTITDLNTIIYGHNMKNGSMFHNLRYYSDKSYYDNHNKIILKTENEDLIWEIFAFYPTDTSFNYTIVNFEDLNQFNELVATMKATSIYETGVTIHENVPILTLSTCTNTSDNMRYVVNAQLLTRIVK